MKAYFLTAFTLVALSSVAQNDSILNKKPDTIRVGNMVIVNDPSESGQNIRNNKRNGMVVVERFKDTIMTITDDSVRIGSIKIVNKREGTTSFGQKNWESFLDGDFKNAKISIDKSHKKPKNVTTNWWAFDIGFTNLVDKTDPSIHPYASYLPYPGFIMPVPSPNSGNLKLNNVKSSNVNIWIVQQKVNLYKHYLNLKYGVGFEMYNFRFEQPISFSNTAGNYVYFDDVQFSKNKLFVQYVTVPVQLNFRSNPDNHKSFFASIGMSAGYLMQSRTKQISEERGKKKVNGNFNLNNFKTAVIGELGIGSIRLYGSYALTNMFDKNLTPFNMMPVAFGIRFSEL
jgi:hypothetical protein